MPFSSHILRREAWKSPYLDTGFLEVTKTWQESRKWLLSSLTCSQIWLFPLVNGCQWLWLYHNIEGKKTLMPVAHKRAQNTWNKLRIFDLQVCHIGCSIQGLFLFLFFVICNWEKRLTKWTTATPTHLPKNQTTPVSRNKLLTTKFIILTTCYYVAKISLQLKEFKEGENDPLLDSSFCKADDQDSRHPMDQNSVRLQRVARMGLTCNSGTMLLLCRWWRDFLLCCCCN